MLILYTEDLLTTILVHCNINILGIALFLLVEGKRKDSENIDQQIIDWTMIIHLHRNLSCIFIVIYSFMMILYTEDWLTTILVHFNINILGMALFLIVEDKKKGTEKIDQWIIDWTIFIFHLKSLYNMMIP